MLALEKVYQSSSTYSCLQSDTDDLVPRIMEREFSIKLLEKIRDRIQGGGEIRIGLTSWWNG